MAISTVRLGGRPDHPLLLLGPEAGTSVQGLWGTAARVLARDFQVVGWDLPGHGSNSRFSVDHRGELPAVSVSGMARDIVEALDRLLDVAPGGRRPAVHYAGHGVGAAVGLRLALDHPDAVASLALVGGWHDPDAAADDGHHRAAIDRVRRSQPRIADALDAVAERTRSEAVAAARRAHAGAGPADQLAGLRGPVLAVVGAEDGRGDPESWRRHLSSPGQHLEVLDGIGRLVAAEAPEAVAALVADHAAGRPVAAGTHGSADDGGACRACGASDGSSLDGRTEALVRVAVAASRQGSTGEHGVRVVLQASREAARAGASPAAVARTLRLAWAERDDDGRLSAKVERLLEASR